MDNYNQKNVYYSSGFSDRNLHEGWVIGFNREMFHAFPYIVAKNIEKRKLIPDYNRWEEFFEENMKNLEYVSDKLISEKTDFIRKRHEILIREFTNFKIVKNNLVFEKELLRVYTNKLLLIKTRAILNSIINFSKKSVSFFWSVLFIGTIFIIFGDLFRLYYGRFQKYKKMLELKDEAKREEFKSMVNLLAGKAGNNSTSKTDIIKKELESIDEKVFSSSNSIITTIIAISGLIIAIIALKDK